MDTILVIGSIFIIVAFIQRAIAEEKAPKCDLHEWKDHELDGHMYCTKCKALPFNEDGERV